MIALGTTVRDKITGFSGVVVGRVVYLSGCNQLLVAPPVDEKGAFRESQWIDEQRADVLDVSPIVLDNTTTPGHDRPAPRR